MATISDQFMTLPGRCEPSQVLVVHRPSPPPLPRTGPNLDFSLWISPWGFEPFASSSMRPSKSLKPHPRFETSPQPPCAACRMGAQAPGEKGSSADIRRNRPAWANAGGLFPRVSSHSCSSPQHPRLFHLATRRILRQEPCRGRRAASQAVSRCRGLCHAALFLERGMASLLVQSLQALASACSGQGCCASAGGVRATCRERGRRSSMRSGPGTAPPSPLQL